VIKRQGGLSPAPYWFGFDYLFNNDVYEDVTYGRDSVVIQRKTSDTGNDLDYRKVIYFKDNKIFRTVVSRDDRLYITYLYFNSSGRIYRTVETTWQKRGSETFYLAVNVKDFSYAGSNLIRVEGEHTTVQNYKSKTVELFENYDEAPNPTRNLIIFDEIFYRSLSGNNFRKYSYDYRTETPGNFLTSRRTWEFEYDSDGVPVFH
jgi:hypothetical protein